MPITAVLGTSDSWLSNIVLGNGGIVVGQTSLTGVLASQVGAEYDFALGYDPGTGTAEMVGYVITENGLWEESTQLQDVERLIQTSTATTTDRDLTRWPKVVQGDWSLGERQLVFTVNNRYYSTNGQLDVTKPGFLTVLPGSTSALTIPAGSLGGNNCWPLGSDGDNWYLGQPNGHVQVGKRDLSVADVTVSAGNEICDVLTFTPSGAASGVLVAAANGIWFIDGSSYALTQWMGGDTVETSAANSICAINGRVYYIQSGGANIKYVAAAGAIAGTQAVAKTTTDGAFRAICTTANGLMWASTADDIPGTRAAGITTLFTSAADTTGQAVIGQIPGVVKYMRTFSGVTYILAHLSEPSSTNSFNYTLYTYNGTTLSVFDDLRYSLPDFQASVSGFTSYAHANIYGDGRFVYFAWPGLQAIQLDLATAAGTTGVSRIAGTGLPGTQVYAHRVVRTRYHGFVDVSVNTTGGTVQTFNGAMGSGQMVTSYYDFSTPSLTKIYRSLDIDLNSPLPGGASITVEYQADSSSTWTLLTTNPTLTTTLTSYFPANVRAKALRLRITLVAGPNSGTPSVRSWGTKANLGRVWRTTVSCKRGQQTNTSGTDGQGKLARDLIANIQRAYANAGKCILLIPSPTVPSGVEQVTASLEDYRWAASKPNVRQNELMALDAEGDVEITAVESL